jgi:hypothetical protein
MTAACPCSAAPPPGEAEGEEAMSPDARRQTQRVTVGMGIMVALVLVYVTAQRPALASEPVPGFAAYMVIRLYDSFESQRKYVFEYATKKNAKAALYLSARGQFTFAVTDIRGDTYPLEVKVGSDGSIPTDQVVILFCEAWATNTSTVLRILVNGKEVARRDLSSRISLENMDWKAGTSGAPIIGPNHGDVFFLFELEKFPAIPTDADGTKFIENVRQYMHLPFN